MTMILEIKNTYCIDQVEFKEKYTLEIDTVKAKLLTGKLADAINELVIKRNDQITKT